MSETITESAQITPKATRASALLTACVIGLVTAVVMWSTGFVTHLPVLQDLPAVSLITGVLLLITQCAGMVLVGWLAPAGRSRLTGVAAGVWVAGINLMVLGSVLAEPPSIDDGSSVRPNALVYLAGFMTFSVVVGLVGSVVGAQLRTARKLAPASYSVEGYVSRLAVVAVIGIAPVLLTGGLVTSTESGLAVPDWPNSYAANMFLYPLSKMTGGAYFEHTHRLFGALAGFGVMTLFLVCVARLIASRRQPSGVEHLRRNAVLSGVALLLVIIQGSLGGLRVITASGAEDTDHWRDAAEATILAGEDVPTNFAVTTDNTTSITLAAMHGVSGQLTLVLVAVVAALLSSRWLNSESKQIVISSALKPATIALFAVTALQLTIGALARHHTHEHALYLHAVLAIAVLVLALFAGFGLQKVGREHEDGLLSTLGGALVALVSAQFVLGWVAFIVVVPHWGETVAEEPAPSVLVATGHQALGAGLLCVTALCAAWTHRILKTPYEGEAVGNADGSNERRAAEPA